MIICLYPSTTQMQGRCCVESGNEVVVYWQRKVDVHGAAAWPLQQLPRKPAEHTVQCSFIVSLILHHSFYTELRVQQGQRLIVLQTGMDSSSHQHIAIILPFDNADAAAAALSTRNYVRYPL
jgi:hypothetical protein